MKKYIILDGIKYIRESNIKKKTVVKKQVKKRKINKSINKKTIINYRPEDIIESYGEYIRDPEGGEPFQTHHRCKICKNEIIIFQGMVMEKSSTHQKCFDNI